MSDTHTPAFPRPAVFTQALGLASVEQDGMTLRDYFAAKAMQAAITGTATRRETFLYSDCAALSYEMADAMLKARGQ